MNIRRFTLVFSVLGTVSLFAFPASAGPGMGTIPDSDAAVRSTAKLKKFMAKFGAMFAGLEILRLKEKSVDWEAIDVTIKEMSDTLSQMQAADADNRYKEYTDVLATSLADMKMQSQNKDKRFFKTLDKLGDSCFRCHAAHRPGDYMVPKGNQMTGKP